MENSNRYCLREIWCVLPSLFHDYNPSPIRKKIAIYKYGHIMAKIRTGQISCPHPLKKMGKNVGH